MDSDLAGRGLRVLIVEDHLPTARSLSKLICHKFEAATVEIATRLDKGLEAAVDFKADITLLDLGLPDANVSEVIHAIVAFPPPVIVVTDASDPDNHLMLMCFEYGAENFYSKLFLANLIDGLPRGAEADKVVSAIVSAVLRDRLPRMRKDREADSEVKDDGRRLL
jgi:DNA-binding NarL/FixJ family response regulator